MILTAYFDESGTHGGSDLALMAGFVGEVRQWRKFEKRTAKLFSRFHVDIFHSIDVKRTDKDFAGWKVDRKIEFLDEFQHIANETLELGFATILRYDDYEYYTKLLWPKGARKDSLYGILFRASLSSVIGGVLRSGKVTEGREPRLNIVLESGHRNSEDAVRLYKFFGGKFSEGARSLSGLTFESKEKCLPLAAADLFAYSAYREETRAKPLGVPAKPLKSEASYRGNAYRVVVGRESLNALHEQAITLAREARVSSR